MTIYMKILLTARREGLIGDYIKHQIFIADKNLIVFDNHSFQQFKIASESLLIEGYQH